MRLRPHANRIAAAALVVAATALQAVEPGSATGVQPPAALATYQATGQVIDYYAQERLLTITHDDIPSLGMSTMTMDFPVAASVDMAAISAGKRVRFVLTLINGILTVTEIGPITSPRGGTSQ